MADQARQAYRTDIHQRDAEAAAVNAEHRVARCHTQVTPEGELQAASDGIPLDGGDHRLGEHQASGPHGTIAGLDAVAAPASRRLLEVVARAERARGTGEHGDVLRRVGIELTEGCGESAGGQWIDGIARSRTIDGDDGDGAVGFDADRIGVGHGGKLATGLSV